MPWGFSGYGGSGGYRAPAPRRLSLEDLLGLDTQAPAPRPAPITSLRDLAGEDRHQAQQQSLWAGLAALGANISGDRRGAVAGLGNIQDAQDRVLAGANARQDATYQEEEARRAAAAREAKQRQEKGALYGMYERAVEGEDPNGPLAQRAETAARAGSMAELEKIAAEKPQRSAARAKGYNPDAWDTTQRLQEELKAELDRQAKTAAWTDEKPRKVDEAGIQTAAENQRVAYRLGLEHGYRTKEDAAKALRDAKKATVAKATTGPGRVILDAGDGTWKRWNDEKQTFEKAPGIIGGVKDRVIDIDGVKHAWNPVTGIAVPIKTQAQLDEEKAAKEEAARPKGPGVFDRIGSAAKNAVSFSGAKPATAPVQRVTPAAPPPAAAASKVTEQDKVELRNEIAARYPNLSPAERDAKYRLALQTLAGH